MAQKKSTDKTIKSLDTTIQYYNEAPLMTAFAEEFDAFLLSIANGTINIEDVKEHILSSGTHNIGDKLIYFQDVISQNLDEEYKDFSKYIVKACEISQKDPVFSKKLEDLFLIGCKSSNEKTCNESINGIEWFYNDNPRKIVETFQRIVENKEGKYNHHARQEALNRATVIAIDSNDRDIYDIVRHTIAFEMMNKDEKDNYCQFAFFRAEDLIKKYNSDFELPTLGKIKEDYPKHINKRLADFYCAILDNSDDFKFPVLHYAMEQAIELATEHPEYKNKIDKRLIKVVCDGKYDDIHMVGKYLKSSGKDEVEKNRTELDYFKDILEAGKVSHDKYKSIIRYRMRGLAEENDGLLRNEVIGVLCREAVKEQNSDDWKRYALESLNHLGLSFKKNNLNRLFKQNAEEIGRGEYAGIVMKIYNTDFQASLTFQDLFHVVGKEIEKREVEKVACEKDNNISSFAKFIR